MRKRIGLLTGTFDPVHLGHVELARAAVKAYGLAGVWYWINAAPSHKSGVTAYEDRLAMVKLAVGYDERLHVYEGTFSLRPHTMQAFAALANEHPDLEFSYLVGADILAGIDRWNDVETVVTDATFLVADRNGGGRLMLDQLRDRLGPLGGRLRASLFAFDEYAPMSSFEAREQLKAGRRHAGLDPKVYEYILERGLYR